MDWIEPATGDAPHQPAHAPRSADIIDLGAADPPTTTRVVLERDLSPFDRLGTDERRCLLVRVLCGLVAYDAPEEPARRLAG
jgi:hypothetical protein